MTIKHKRYFTATPLKARTTIYVSDAKHAAMLKFAYGSEEVIREAIKWASRKIIKDAQNMRLQFAERTSFSAVITDSALVYLKATFEPAKSKAIGESK